jgi:hypothetical protein
VRADETTGAVRRIPSPRRSNKESVIAPKVAWELVELVPVVTPFS